ncbi:MAG: ABC transporter permease [Oscillospiraceae bacterium]|nr:ABC transporter permease [Oscillospiraceae bacterium]
MIASPIFTGVDYDDAMLEAAANAISAGVNAFVAEDGTVYAMKEESKSVYNLEIVSEIVPVSLFSDYTFKLIEKDTVLSPELKAQTLLHSEDQVPFTVDGVEYFVDEETKEIITTDGEAIAVLSNVSVVDSNAQDTFSVEFVAALTEVLTEMRENKVKDANFTWNLLQKEPVTGEDGQQKLVDKLDANGNPMYADETLQITDLIGTYTITRNMAFYVNNSYAPMDKAHPFGTDGNGMDMLARMMYGGRISLMVGFVVVIISMTIGVIMGGIAGYFGGWVDTLIMRLVEIFYCIPSYPILIILGGFMDAARKDAIFRLYVMMAVLGFLSWAGVARLVRGQILSLREQEFMVATEATGTKVRHRIFRHLVPNVMPQLIVSATGSLGSVILTESSLSFLGLGVKFPLATWGNMIEFVTGLNENLGRYIYIWLPVGVLICLTVISFNFVGDGLRDAFDPKMKR